MSKERIDKTFGIRDSKRIRKYLNSQHEVTYEETTSVRGSHFTVYGESQQLGLVVRYLRYLFS